jgi:hypothetical protein
MTPSQYVFIESRGPFEFTDADFVADAGPRREWFTCSRGRRPQPRDGAETERAGARTHCHRAAAHRS